MANGNTFFIQYSWLIPVIPFFSFLFISLFVRPFSARLAGVIATLSVTTSMCFAYGLAYSYISSFHGASVWPTFVASNFEWLRYQELFSVHAGVLVDSLSVVLIVIVTTISSLVHLYSTAYMHGERGYARYFAFLNLFTASMLGLVVAPNLIQMFVCWELVGASSFLLISFYYDRPSAVSASKKAFIVTRFADLGFLLGIILLGYFAHEFASRPNSGIEGQQAIDFLFINSSAVTQHFASLTWMGTSILTLSLVLIYLGAAGKSAMFPLHIWLPDAMEGPTPVSALIHAATMVVAGVYLVARMFPLFLASETALHIVASVGAFTCIFAAVIACTQNDMKRILAFSTLSQLGYMMFALGVSSADYTLGYTAGIFHLFTHACFKALLFLGAGAVIHAVHENDIWKMGSLAKKMPVTHITVLVATLAISGIWPFAGFFSKDEILSAALHSGHFVVFSTGLVVAALTAFYMFRMYFVAFWGSERSASASHAHEVSLVMLIPLGILAILSLCAGWLPVNRFVTIGTPAEHTGIDLYVVIPGTVAAVAGILCAVFFYVGNTTRAKKASELLGWFYNAIRSKFYFDEIYLFITHRLIFRFVAQPIAWFDRNVVDRCVDLSGNTTRNTGNVFSTIQTGQVQTYGTWFVGGVVSLLLILWVIR